MKISKIQMIQKYQKFLKIWITGYFVVSLKSKEFKIFSIYLLLSFLRLLGRTFHFTPYITSLMEYSTLQNLLQLSIILSGEQFFFRRFFPKFETLFIKSDYLFMIRSTVHRKPLIFSTFWELLNAISKKRCVF